MLELFNMKEITTAMWVIGKPTLCQKTIQKMAFCLQYILFCTILQLAKPVASFNVIGLLLI